MKCLWVPAGLMENLSHPVRGAWIEMGRVEYVKRTLRSHPVRGAWIEMAALSANCPALLVAPREGCVD